ncbi:MAG: glutamyl-tRNA reductase [Xanthomonadales bacterium]|nr:glutamyl-tRNA reductase [Xanthomonadales bacterium]NIX13996.1 glutamyl-tRNA reductase [Xanthomonadales bacterium]
MPLLSVGTSHQTAPLEIRERLAFARDDYAAAVTELCAIPAVEEALVLSTCNRTEIYGVVLPEDEQCIMDWIQRNAGLDDEAAAEYIYSRKDAVAVEHLFNVASGLDSLVLGEPQIVGQLKESWQHARDAGGIGKILDRLFQHAFATGKAVRTKTGINQHPVSVAYISMVLARQIFGDLASKHVLLVGAGEMIQLCGRHLYEQGVASLMIANRSLERAEVLAAEFGATAHSLDQLEEVLPKSDILITSTAARQPFITRDLVKAALRKRRRQPMFLVDIAVPRDISPDVSGLDDVYVYTIDDLQQVADENAAERTRAAKAAGGMVRKSVDEFMRWLHGARAAKFLKRLRDHAEESSDMLVERALRQVQAGKDPEQVIRQLANTLTHKILHIPSTRLRQAAEQQEYGILKAADWLFDSGAEEDDKA